MMDADKATLIKLFKQYHAYKEDHIKEFLLTSGQRSPFSVDCRVLMGHHDARVLVAHMAAQVMHMLPFTPDSIGGLATGSVMATAIADYDRAGYRTFSVRKESKGHGLELSVEGAYDTGDMVVIVDEVLTSGGSIKTAADQVGATTALVIVDREQGGREYLAECGIEVHPLLTLSDLRGSDAI